MSTRFRLMQECKSMRSLERGKRGSVSKRLPIQLSVENSQALSPLQFSGTDACSNEEPNQRPDQSSKIYPSPSTTEDVFDTPRNVESHLDSPGQYCEDTLFSFNSGLASPFPEEYSPFPVQPAMGLKSSLDHDQSISYATTDDGKSLLSTDTGKKSKRSGISLTSLRKRLLSKHPATSLLNEVKSLLESLTISSGSTASLNRPPTTPARDTASASVPETFKHAVMLPGFFHQYCWEHINHNTLRRCDDVKLPCTFGPIFTPIGNETHRTIRNDVLFRIRACIVRKDDLNEVDAFGNSVLHIVASLEAPPSYLLSLVQQSANVNSLNNANQTFLHLVSISNTSQIADFRLLLKVLARRHFNFEQQDDNGQTACHALTGLSVDEDILAEVVQCFQLYGLPTSRDSLGATVSSQLRGAAQSLVLEHQYTQFQQVDDLPIVTATRLPPENNEVDPTIDKVERHGSIETIEDLQEYEFHADLLRTILRAGEDPAFEDADGRNGLHCLAQVSFDLPQSTLDPHQPSSFEKKETYLDQLLLAGVNPNSHDEHGDTPLMAFIATQRVSEDDSSTTQLLQRLVDAGASLSRRNRHGETALHIAVSRGNRVATNFLLSQRVNVHARTGEGLGVVAHGLKASNKAKEDEKLYAQIVLCVALVSSAGAVAAPTILQEWASPSFKIRKGSMMKQAPPPFSSTETPRYFFF
jgi:ankyrin repeat protein